jgi:hypothetical protein
MEFATQTSIQMTGAGLLGRDTASAGKSKRITIGAGLSLAAGVLTNTTDLTSYLTSSAAALAYQPLDTDLTALAGLTPGNDDFVQRKAGAWSNRTIAQVKTDLGLSGTNTGDQDLSGYATTAAVAAGYQPLDPDLTALAALAPSNDDFVQRKAGAWTNRTIAQVKTDLGLSGTNTGDQDLSSYATTAAVALGYQPLDSDLTSIGGLAPSNDDFIQRKAGAWTNRTVAQIKADLGLTGTNSGDQTITLTGDVTGSGTGAFTATIGSGVVSLAKLADMATASVYYRKTGGTGSPEVQTLATLKTDLGLSGTNSGDNAVNTLYSSLVSNATHTGDVTGATALTIANDAVTYAKMQNVSATDRILGRSTSGAGDIEEITCTSAARSILDDATVSDMVNTLGGATSTGTGGLVRLNAPTLQGGVLVEAGGNFTTNYGAPAQLRVRRAQGTRGSPAQATNGIQLGIIGAQGMNDALAFAGYTAYISFNAAQNITTTGCGGYYNFYTTPVGSLTEVMRAWIGAAGNIGIGVFAAEPSTLLTINGDLIRIMTAKTPASSAAAGNAGEFCWDTTYFYGCTAANTWKRIAWTTF